MQTFITAREAKEFVISRIVAEAQREGVALSEVERKMMYFSESAWTLPDISDVNTAFDRDYDQEEYERKIRALSRNFAISASKNNENELTLWKAALRTLRQEDHYLLVLVAAEGQTSNATWTRWLKFLLIGSALAIFALVVMYFVLGR